MNGSTNVSAINEIQMDNLILELNDDVDDIKFILHDIDMKIYDTGEYFKGNVADALRNKYDFYKRKSEIFLKNLSSYSDDLLAVKNSLKSNDTNAKNAYETLKEEVTNANNNMK